MARLRRLTREDRETLSRPESPGLFESIEAYLTARDAAGRSPATLTSYRWHLYGFHQATGNVTLDEVSADDVNRHLVQIRDGGFKPHSVLGRHQALAAFFHWCEKDDRIERTPMRAVTAPRLPNVAPPGFTVEQVRAMLAACNTRTPVGARDFALLAVLYGTALRIAEVVQLQKADVLRGGPAELPQFIRIIGKGQKERLTALQPEAQSAITRYLRLRGDDDEPSLWLGERGALTVSGAYQAVKKRGAQADIPDAHPHRFRRAALAALAARDVDPLALQQISGHADLKMLRHYVAHREQERANGELLKAGHLAEVMPAAERTKRKR